MVFDIPVTVKSLLSLAVGKSKEGSAGLFAVETFSDEPTDVCSLGLALGGSLAKLCGSQLYFQAVHGFVDENVRSRWRVFRGSGVPKSRYHATQVELHPLMLEARRTAARRIRYPVIARAANGLEL